MRLLAELHARWEREDEMARKNNLAKVCTITTSSKTETPNASKPPTTNGKSESVGKVPLIYRKVQKPIKNTPDKCAETFRNMGANCPFTLMRIILILMVVMLLKLLSFYKSLLKLQY